MPAHIPHIDSLADIIARYDAVISDVWGVLHNGLVATPGAREALMDVKASGRPVVLLTNAPRPPESIAAQLLNFGIGEASYTTIISSGGETRTLMEKEGAAPFFHMGPERDHALFAGLPARQGSLDRADYILCTGLHDDEHETAEDYRPALVAALERNLRLFCANPDLVVERGTQLLPCAGAIAELYEQLGGPVTWVGKPRPLVYSLAKERIETALGRPVEPARVLCIGDAFRTDIAGANAAGHDSILTLAGIHSHQIGLEGASFDKARLEELAAQAKARPTMSMVRLRW